MITAKELIEFEHKICGIFEEGVLPFLLHLSGGNEEELIDLFRRVKAGDWVMSNHRSHYHFLLTAGVYGKDGRDKLEQMIRDGRSMFVFDREINFMASSILGGLCGVAAGVAKALKDSGSANRVWCFVGDGAEDNGHLYEGVKYCKSADLPCMFVIEDNNRSCGVTRAQRSADYTLPWPESHVLRIVYQPTYPHAGTGTKNVVEFDPAVVARFKNR